MAFNNRQEKKKSEETATIYAGRKSTKANEPRSCPGTFEGIGGAIKKSLGDASVVFLEGRKKRNPSEDEGCFKPGRMQMRRGQAFSVWNSL